jgi:di/tricarboxylate transporter
VPGGDLGLRDRAGADCGSGYIGKSDFRKFGLIFGLICFSGLLLIVMPWLRVV